MTLGSVQFFHILSQVAAEHQASPEVPVPFVFEGKFHLAFYHDDLPEQFFAHIPGDAILPDSRFNSRPGPDRPDFIQGFGSLSQFIGAFRKIQEHFGIPEFYPGGIGLGSVLPGNG